MLSEGTYGFCFQVSAEIVVVDVLYLCSHIATLNRSNAARTILIFEEGRSKKAIKAIIINRLFREECQQFLYALSNITLLFPGDLEELLERKHLAEEHDRRFCLPSEHFSFIVVSYLWEIASFLV